MTTTPPPADPPLLCGTAMRSDPHVPATARALGARHGVDCTDDAAMTLFLAERHRAVTSAERGPLAARVPELSPRLRRLPDEREY